MLFGLVARTHGVHRLTLAWAPSGPPQRVHAGEDWRRCDVPERLAHDREQKRWAASRGANDRSQRAQAR
jgi:hypothetical protein